MTDLEQLQQRLRDAVAEARQRHDWRVRAFISILEQFRRFLGGDAESLSVVAGDRSWPLDEAPASPAFVDEIRRQGLRVRLRLRLDAESQTSVDTNLELEQGDGGALTLHVAGTPFPIAAVTGEPLRPAYAHYKRRVAEVLDSHSPALAPSSGPRVLLVHD